MISRVAILGALVALVYLSARLDASPVDSINSFDAGTISSLCDDKNARISRSSTVSQLVDHFKSSKGSTCQEKYWLPIQVMKYILELSEKDACSLETINQIEFFHWFYVAKTLDGSWRKASHGGEIPEPLRLFFLHFAEQTYLKCVSSVESRLEQAISSSGFDPESQAIKEAGMGGMMIWESFGSLMTNMNIEHLSDFSFMFNSVNYLERKEGKSQPKANSVSGDVTYVTVALRDVDKEHKVQDACRQLLRPIYTNTVLPLMKLVDLGYGGEEEIGQLLVAHWYKFTQFCELVLPVKYTENKELDKNHVAVINDYQTRHPEGQEEPINAPSAIQVEPAHLDDELPEADDDQVVKRVKKNFSTRTSLYLDALKKATSFAKKEIKTGGESLLVARADKQGEMMPLNKALDHIEKVVPMDNLDYQKTARFGYSRVALISTWLLWIQAGNWRY